MQDSTRSSPAPIKAREESPLSSRLSISRTQSPSFRSTENRINNSHSRIVSSPVNPSFRSSTPGAYESPRSLRRASSSLSQTGPGTSSPQARRKMSNSSLRSATNPSSPAGSPRRGSVRAPSAISSYSTILDDHSEEPPAPTAASIASDYFTRELALHESESTNVQVAVLLHDACYGHRFSRPKTTKANLSMIVERPERVLAAVLGLSAAYVRLGSRHAEGQFAPHPERAPDSRIPFKIRKTSRSVSLTSPFIAAVHGTEWMEELQGMCSAAGERLTLGVKELTRTESTGAPPKEQFHEGDLYLCSESLNALQGAIGGVCDAVDTVFSSIPNSPRRAFVAIRPPGHHCSSDFPSGFCWINNVHIAIEYAAQTYGLTHAAILDIDLHHGDGSQDVTWERNAKSAKMPKNASYTKKTAIGYYSMHDINSYPCEWGEKEKVQNASLCIDNAHGQSIWNVHLEPYKSMEEFWALYEKKYMVLLEKARTFLKRHTATIRASHKQAPPRAAIFISAGFDASEWEGAGMQRHAVNVPTEFYARFAKDVAKLAQEEGTAVNGRVISVLEGGYSDRALTSGVLSHISGLCQDPQAPSADTQLQADDDIVNAMQNMNIANGSAFKVPEYDTNWWHIKNLQALETYVTPLPPPAPVRSQRTAMPTYATPTQSFTGKVVDPVKFQRSVSGTMRPLTPKPSGPHKIPEVDWIVAVHELSKLIIPSDRQTRSHAPEDLAPPRAKKDRLSGPAAAPTQHVDPSGRSLRVRKGRNANTVSPPPETDIAAQRPPLDTNRRQTMADMSTLPSTAETVEPPKRVTRRSSSVFDSIETTMADVPPIPVMPTQPVQENTKPLPSRAKKSRTPVTSVPSSRVTSPRRSRFDSEPQPQIEAQVQPKLQSEPQIQPAPHPVSQPEPQPEVTQIPYRPSVKRTPSQPGSLPFTVDFTKPINHIEPLKPVRRIHFKVGTREDHDRRQREAMEVEAQTIAEARSRLRKVSAEDRSERSVSVGSARSASGEQQKGGAQTTFEPQPAVQEPRIVQHQISTPPPAETLNHSVQSSEVPLTIPSRSDEHSTSPLLLDTRETSPSTSLPQPSSDFVPTVEPPQTASINTEPTPSNPSESQSLNSNPPAPVQPQEFEIPQLPQQPPTTNQHSQAPDHLASQPQPPHHFQPNTTQPLQSQLQHLQPQQQYHTQRNNLPTFSSTGTIPFAAPTAERAGRPKTVQHSASHGNGVSVSMAGVVSPPLLRTENVGGGNNSGVRREENGYGVKEENGHGVKAVDIKDEDVQAKEMMDKKHVKTEVKDEEKERMKDGKINFEQRGAASVDVDMEDAEMEDA